MHTLPRQSTFKFANNQANQLQSKRSNKALTDRVFFPLVLMLIGGTILLSMTRFGSALPTGSISGAASDYVTHHVTGADLNRFVVSSAGEMDLIETGEGYKLEIRARNTELPELVSAGPHFRFAPDMEVAFSDRDIEITVRARSSKTAGAEAFEINYLSGPEGGSGWQRFPLTSEFTAYTFPYRVPEASGERGVDFLGLRPVGDVVGRGMEIESLTIVNLSLRDE